MTTFPLAGSVRTGQILPPMKPSQYKRYPRILIPKFIRLLIRITDKIVTTIPARMTASSESTNHVEETTTSKQKEINPLLEFVWGDILTIHDGHPNT